jgi:hypothetical protein
LVVASLLLACAFAQALDRVHHVRSAAPKARLARAASTSCRSSWMEAHLVSRPVLDVPSSRPACRRPPSAPLPFRDSVVARPAVGLHHFQRIGRCRQRTGEQLIRIEAIGATSASSCPGFNSSACSSGWAGLAGARPPAGSAAAGRAALTVRLIVLGLRQGGDGAAMTSASAKQNLPQRSRPLHSCPLAVHRAAVRLMV